MAILQHLVLRCVRRKPIPPVLVTAVSSCRPAQAKLSRAMDFRVQCGKVLTNLETLFQLKACMTLHLPVRGELLTLRMKLLSELSRFKY